MYVTKCRPQNIILIYADRVKIISHFFDQAGLEKINWTRIKYKIVISVYFKLVCNFKINIFL